MNDHRYIHDPREDAGTLESFFRGLDSLVGFKSMNDISDRLGWNPARFNNAVDQLCQDQEIRLKFKPGTKIIALCHRLMPYTPPPPQAIKSLPPVEELEDAADVKQALQEEAHGNTMAAALGRQNTRQRANRVSMKEKLDKLETLIKERAKAGNPEGLGK